MSVYNLLDDVDDAFVAVAQGHARDGRAHGFAANVTEDHQRKNALALVARNAAVMVEDATAATQLVPAVTALLADPARREAMGAAISGMALRDSDERIVTPRCRPRGRPRPCR